MSKLTFLKLLIATIAPFTVLGVLFALRLRRIWIDYKPDKRRMLDSPDEVVAFIQRLEAERQSAKEKVN